MTAQPTSRCALLKGAALLTAVPVAASAGGVPLFDVVGGPEPIADETPIARLLQKWEAAHAEQDAALTNLRGDFQSKVAQGNAIYDTLGARQRRIEEAILAEPATDLRDFAIKVLVNFGEGSWGLGRRAHPGVRSPGRPRLCQDASLPLRGGEDRLRSLRSPLDSPYNRPSEPGACVVLSRR